MNRKTPNVSQARLPDEALLHIRWRGKVSGPFSRAAVLAMLRNNRISRHHELSEDGLTWRPIAKSGLLATSAGQKTELTVVSETGDPSRDEASGQPAYYVPPSSSGSYFASARAARQEADSAEQMFDARSVALVLAFGLAPLFYSLLQMTFQLRFLHAAWFFSAYFCIMWVWIVARLGEWRKDVLRTGIYYSLFTAFIGTSMLLLWHHIPVFASLYSGLESAEAWVRLLGFVAGVGLCEELCKAAPLLLFGLRPKLIKSPSDGICLGFMSGLGFAMSEAVEYTLDYWWGGALQTGLIVSEALEKASNQQEFKGALYWLFEQHGAIVVAQLIRFISLPLLHAAWTGMVGYAVAHAFLRGRWILVAAALSTAAVLHGLYDFLTPTPALSVLCAGISVALMMVLLIRETRLSRMRT